MKLFALMLSVGIVASAAGCSHDKAAEAAATSAARGTVDESLPPALRAKQQTVAKLLNTIQEGVGDTAGLRIYAPNLAFREPFGNFFAGRKRLVRWQFNGPPDKDSVPVSLWFDDQELGPNLPAPTTQDDRVYVVTIAGRQAAITRRK